VSPPAPAPVGVDVGLIDEGCRASGKSSAPYHLSFTAVFSDGHHMAGLSVDTTSSSVDEVYVSYGGRSMFQVASGADFTC
jgi:hypothetical protein